MAYNPAGIFSLIASYFAEPGTTIRTEQHNPVFEDVAAGLSQVLVRDGRAPMIGPLNMNGFAINGVVAGSSPTSVATLAQVTPIGVIMDYAGVAAPTGWAFCFGQELSRTTDADLFAVIGTIYGPGNGSTTFNAPDCRGRVTAGKDNMGGVTAGRLTTAGSGVNGVVLGSAGGSEDVTLTAAQLAPHPHSGNTGTESVGHFHGGGALETRPVSVGGDFVAVVPAGSGGTPFGLPNTGGISANHFHGITTNGGDGVLGQAHQNTQPTIIMNKIIRVSYDG